MKDHIMRDLMDQYAQLRMENQQLAHSREQALFDENPALYTLDQAHRKRVSDAMQAVLERPDESDQIRRDLTAALDEMTAKRVALLAEAGYPANYLDTPVRCPVCRDYGFVGQPYQKPCECLQQRYLQALYRQNDMPELSEQNFETFDASIFQDATQRAQMEKARDFCLQYAQSLPAPDKPNLLMMGKTGMGKTFLLNCIAKYALDHGLSVIKLSAYRLVELVLDREQGGGLEMLYHADVLLLDDLGAEPMLNNVTIESLYSIVNERTMHRRPIVIATNLTTPTGLQAQYADRVASRLLDASLTNLLRLTGQDIRSARR